MMLAVDRLIAAPSSAAWNVLVDLDAWPQWGPTVSGARLDSPHTELSLGATGVVRTSLGFGVPFVVTEFEPGRHWAWKVAGIPATSHRVQPVGRQHTSQHQRPVVGHWLSGGVLDRLTSDRCDVERRCVAPGHQPVDPGIPLNGPAIQLVIQPP